MKIRDKRTFIEDYLIANAANASQERIEYAIQQAKLAWDILNELVPYER